MRSLLNKVCLSNGKEYRYWLPWDGRMQLYGTLKSPIAIDTETELIDKQDPTHIPRMALATISDGKRSFFVHPDQIANFVVLHQTSHFVGQNMNFDFWVIDHFLAGLAGEQAVEAKRIWWEIANAGRLHDTILLDMLIRLAQAAGFEAYSKEDTALSKRNLGELALDYLGLVVDKSDPFRLRYGELLDRDWNTVEEAGFWTYAIKDAIVTQLLWQKQAGVAEQLLSEARSQSKKAFLPNALKDWGYLTESLQTRATLALAFMGRKGIRVDTEKAIEQEVRHREEIRSKIALMWEFAPEVFKYRRVKVPGVRKLQQLPTLLENVILTEKGQTPQMDTKALVAHLEGVAERENLLIPYSKGKRGVFISKSSKAWAKYRAVSPFIDAWMDVALLSKRLAFFQNLRDKGFIYPRYRPLMRTGRTSCTKPNIQQFPREEVFRSIFIARPGHKLLTIDYSAIELRTLSYVCEYRYGFSVLADTIRAGIDPHAYTASMLLSMQLDEFMRLKQTDESTFKNYRQKGKVINFGVPGGLGAVKLSAYAAASYGVEMTVEEAATLRHKLINNVYPELNLYLSDTTLDAIKFNLSVSKKDILRAFNIDTNDDPQQLFRALRSLGKILRGKPFKADGTPYKERFVERMWENLKRLVSNSGRLSTAIREQISKRTASDELERTIMCGPAFTVTGRIRGSATYTQSRNCPFQGLAADGGKLAMWNCLMAGLTPIAFIHDELVVEIPEERVEEDSARVEQILISNMMQVMDGKMPVECSMQIADCWQK